MRVEIVTAWEPCHQIVESIMDYLQINNTVHFRYYSEIPEEGRYETNDFKKKYFAVDYISDTTLVGEDRKNKMLVKCFGQRREWTEKTLLIGLRMFFNEPQGNLKDLLDKMAVYPLQDEHSQICITPVQMLELPQQKIDEIVASILPIFSCTAV